MVNTLDSKALKVEIMTFDERVVKFALSSPFDQGDAVYSGLSHDVGGVKIASRSENVWVEGSGALQSGRVAIADD